MKDKNFCVYTHLFVNSYLEYSEFWNSFNQQIKNEKIKLYLTCYKSFEA